MRDRMSSPTTLPSVLPRRRGICTRHSALLTIILTTYMLPNVITYAAAISACATALQWQQTLGLLASLRCDVVLPVVILHYAAISAGVLTLMAAMQVRICCQILVTEAGCHISPSGGGGMGAVEGWAAFVGRPSQAARTNTALKRFFPGWKEKLGYTGVSSVQAA